MAESLLPADHVRVRNLSDEDFSSAFDSKPYTIPAGGDAIIPREAAAKDFGDWTKRNGRKPERDREMARLRGLYGALDGMDGAEDRWTKNRPKVELYEVTGQRIVGVLDDPKGETLPASGGSDPETQGTVDQLRAQMAAMQRQMENLLNQEPEIEDVPEDTPQPKARRKREAPFEPAREA